MIIIKLGTEPIAALDCQGGAAVVDWNFALPCQLMSMVLGERSILCKK